MKKWLVCMLAAVLVFSAMVTIASAAEGPTISVSIDGGNEIVLSKSDVDAGGKEITVNFSVNGSQNFKALQFDVVFPGTFTYQSVSGPKMSDFSNSNNKFSTYDVNGVALTDLFTLTLKVDKAAASERGTNKIEIKNVKVSYADDSKPTVADSSLDGITVKHADDAHDWGVAVEEPKANCTTNGLNTWTCACGKQKTEATLATGHNITFYGNENSGEQGKFKWTDDPAHEDKATAEVWVYCSNSNCPDYNVENGVKKEATVSTLPGSTATCTEAGSTKFSATITIEDKKKTEGWTLTDDTYERQGKNPLGHDWTGDIDWSKWSEDNPEQAFEVSLTCKRCGTAKLTTTVQAEKDAGSSQEPTCEHGGNYYYKVSSFGFDESQDTVEQSKGSVPKNVEEHTFGPVWQKALGHDWPESREVTFTWTNEADGTLGATAKANIKCKRSNCDSEQYKVEKDYDATVTQNVTQDPNCTAGGSVTYTATIDSSTLPGLETPYTETGKTESLDALGHDFADEATFNWPTTAGVDNKDQPTGVTATLRCNRENTNIQSQSVTVMDGTSGKVEPTYEKDGTYYWKATATFPNAPGGGTTEKVEDDHPYTVPKLEAAAETPTKTTTEANGADATSLNTDALKNDVLKQVEDALVNNNTGSLQGDLVEALKGAGANNEAGMKVDTELVIKDDTSQKTGHVTGVAGVTDDDVKTYYDIHIDVKVSGGGLQGEKTGTITEIGTPIEFTVPKPVGGPIWYVMTDHGNSWNKIDSKVVENNIVFSSKQFSHFAVISSNNIADADVDPLPSVTYNGSAFTPKPKVTINGGQVLEEGVDYDLEYKNNTNVGTATVVIKAHADNDLGLTGTKEVTFSIVQAPAKGGSGAGGSNAKDAPDTGDNTPLALYAVLVVLSATALTAAVLVLRRKHSGK